MEKTHNGPLEFASGGDQLSHDLAGSLRLLKSEAAKRSVFYKTNNVGAVIGHNVLEFRNGHPNWLG